MNWLSYLGIGFSIITTIFNIVIILAIKMNDLKHVQKSSDELKNKVDEIDKRMDSIAERISCVEGKIKAKKR